MDDEEYDSTNLADIVGQADYASTRVVAFEPESDAGTLVVREMCDQYFTIELNKVEVQRLIDWLNTWLGVNQ